MPSSVVMWPRVSAVIFAVLVTVTCGSSSPTRRSNPEGDERDESDGRLPRDILPFHYHVELNPDLYSDGPPFTFTGGVWILFTVVNPTTVITLNSRGLNIDGSSISVVYNDGGLPDPPVVSGWSLNEDAQFLYINVTQPLLTNTEYVVAVANFSGTMRADGYGLYWDSYTDTDGATKFVAATQFQSHGARRTFPSFDEPDFKATFLVVISRKLPFVSVSNMPLTQTNAGFDGWLYDMYDTSTKMSCYLVAFAVGDLVKLDAGSINGYEVGIWSRPQMLPQLGFAHNTAPRIQAWLDHETGFRYQQPKSDHICFPNKGGAMENWGLITYGEDILTINPETSSTDGKQYSASIISHESAHLWYGDLITCRWWDDAWLNEGFATYYEYRPTQALGWEGSEASQVDTQSYLESDQRNTSDPVRKEIPAPWFSGLAFSGSTYPKGGAMVHFLEGLLTSDVFKRGLSTHISRHSYDTATTDDLWQSLTDQAASDGITFPDGSPLDVKLIMDPWLNQMGFPLVSVTRRTDGTATVARTHFLRPPGQIMERPSPYNYEWPVPITLVTADSPTTAWDAAPSAYIYIDETETVVSGFPPELNRWAVINAKASFYYRVRYDDLSFAAIVSQLLADNTVIHVESRNQFIDDAFSVSRAGYIPETWAMDSTLYLASEEKWGPWNSALRHLKYSDRLIRNLPWGGLQRSYLLSLAIPIYQRLGWNHPSTETPFEHFLRRDMISVSCTYGDADCLAEARSQYALITPDPSANVVDANNLPTVLCVGVNEGTEVDWQLSFDQYLARKSSQIREERYAYLFGCACTSDPALLDRLLVELETNVESRDRNRLGQYLSQTDYGAQILWDYLDANWNSLPGGLGGVDQLRNVAMGFSNQAELDELYAFIANHPPLVQEDTVYYTNLILDVEANVAWVESEGPALEQWLIDHQPTGLNLEKRNGRPVNLPNSAMEHWAGVRASYRSTRHHF